MLQLSSSSFQSTNSWPRGDQSWSLIIFYRVSISSVSLWPNRKYTKPVFPYTCRGSLKLFVWKIKPVVFYGFLHIRYVIHFKKPEKLWLLQVFAGSVYLVKGPLQAKWHINLRWDIAVVGTCYSSPCFPLCSTKNNFLADVRHIAGLESDVQCFTAAVLTRRTFLKIL